MRGWQRCVLQARVDELDVAHAPQLISRARDQLVTGVDRGNAQTPAEQGPRQLPGAATDLEHGAPGPMPATSHACSISASG